MAAALVAAAVSQPASAGVVLTYSSTRDALKQGISAYNGGYFEVAVPALEYAAAQNEFMALYYLARIYADNSSSLTDHGKAYILYRRIADEYADADPDDDPRAPYVGRALTALARYVQSGLPEIGLPPDAALAAEYLYNASASFNDEDAQFELAKLQLKGEVDGDGVRNGQHWISVLSERGHAGAQAFLADLMWRGKFVAEDRPKALALIAVAATNATPSDRLWIDDIYQNIYCGAGEGIRKQATGIVAGWGNRYGRKPATSNPVASDTELAAAPVRTCENGEPVNDLSTQPVGPLGPRSALEASAESAAPQKQGREVPTGFSYGGTSASPSIGSGLQDAGVKRLELDQPQPR